LGGSVRAAASVALAGRSHRPGRVLSAADKISLNGCLTRLMIFGGSDIKFTFQLTRTVFADDAIQAQGEIGSRSQSVSRSGRKIRPLQSEGAKPDLSVFMKFDHPVLLPKRGHGIEVRIN
jgi:hypothetical protein